MLKSKKRTDKQIVTIDQFTREIKSVAIMKSFAMVMMCFGVNGWLYFLGFSIVPLWLCACLAGGFVWWVAADHVYDGIYQWLKNLAAFRETEEGEDSTDANPIKENGRNVAIEIIGRRESGPIVRIPMTVAQVWDIAKVSNERGFLRRDNLDRSIWHNLTRDWQDGLIQEKLRRLGIIDETNMFLVGEYLHSSVVPEVESNE